MSTAPRLPDFLCIGAQRCGTTTLWELLARHPRIFLPETKELHYFDDRDGSFAAGIDSYAAHFADAPDDAVCGESSPEYLYFPEAGDRIAEALPDARLIAILRDPVERAWSHYWFNVRRGREWLSFEEALDREPERIADRADAKSRPWYSYVDRGRYVEQLRRFETLFGREQLLVVLLDDLRADPAGTMETVFAHIELESDGVDTRIVPERNRLVRPRSRRLHRLSSSASSWGRQAGTPLHQAARAGAALVRSLNMSTARVELRPETRVRLQETFAESDAELVAWLGRPLPWSPTDVSQPAPS